MHTLIEVLNFIPRDSSDSVVKAFKKATPLAYRGYNRTPQTRVHN
jgi:hypothetical protein